MRVCTDEPSSDAGDCSFQDVSRDALFRPKFTLISSPGLSLVSSSSPDGTFN